MNRYPGNHMDSETVTVPRELKTRPGAPQTHLAYITGDEARMLQEHKPGTPHGTKSGVPNYDAWGEDGGWVSSGDWNDVGGSSGSSNNNNNNNNNSWSSNDWADEFSNTGVTVDYDPHAGSSVYDLPSNVPWEGPTGPSTPGSGNNMAADFFGTTTVLPDGTLIPIGNLGDVFGNNYENEFIGDLINYGEFGYGPGPQWDDELTEFFGGTPEGGFSHAHLTEYLYGQFLLGEESLGINDDMFLGGNPGQIGYGPGVKPDWYGQPRPSTTGGNNPGGSGWGGWGGWGSSNLNYGNIGGGGKYADWGNRPFMNQSFDSPMPQYYASLKNPGQPRNQQMFKNMMANMYNSGIRSLV